MAKKKPTKDEVMEMTPEEIDKKVPEMPASPQRPNQLELNDMRIKKVLSGELKAARVKYPGNKDRMDAEEKNLSSQGLDIVSRGANYFDISKGVKKPAKKQPSTEEPDQD